MYGIVMSTKINQFSSILYNKNSWKLCLLVRQIGINYKNKHNYYIGSYDLTVLIYDK